MKKTIILLLTALLLIVSVCSAMAELDTENPVLIGYVGALSGDTALWGQAGLNGMELTAKQINEAGGILGREVKVIGLDGKGVSDDSVAAYKKLVEEYGVVAVVVSRVTWYTLCASTWYTLSLAKQGIAVGFPAGRRPAGKPTARAARGACQSVSRGSPSIR
jgi:hypothetical protein